ncbi:MAG: hypothetical protein P4L28_08430 [Paludibacteraceae bacterium]|nr:hypothetical protein [Paludibacteraceae bacterium]
MSLKIKNYLYLFFGIIVILSIVAFIYSQQFALYTYAAGALGMTILRVSSLSSAKDSRVRRLNNIQALSAILLLGAAYLMYIKFYGWLIAIVISAVIDLYVSFRMPSEKEKETEK